MPRGRSCSPGEWHATGPKIDISDAPTLELPPGFRLWREGDDDQAPAPTQRKGLLRPDRALPAACRRRDRSSPSCYRGQAAHAVRVHYRTSGPDWNGEHFHHANLFTLTPGKTLTGAKGVAHEAAKLLVGEVEPEFAAKHVIGGFGSGKPCSTTSAISTRKRNPVLSNTKSAGWSSSTSSLGSLVVAHRENSIFSMIIRNAFDYDPIPHRTKTLRQSDLYRSPRQHRRGDHS